MFTFKHNWHTIEGIAPSNACAIVYETILTKGKAIPLYRQANEGGETGDIICADVTSFNKSTNSYEVFFSIPFQHIAPAGENVRSSEIELNQHMEINCEVLGIKVNEGQKNSNWVLSRSPTKARFFSKENPLIISNYYTKEELKEETVITEVIEEKVVKKEETICGKNGVVYILSDEVTEDKKPIYYLKERGKGRPKQFIEYEGDIIGLKEMMLALATTSTTTTEPKHKGRVRVNPISPELENLFNLGHRGTKCCECGKDIVIQEAFIEKAKKMEVDPIWLVSNYKCRSCGGVIRKKND
jgi:hypothetical protein